MITLGTKPRYVSVQALVVLGPRARELTAAGRSRRGGLRTIVRRRARVVWELWSGSASACSRSDRQRRRGRTGAPRDPVPGDARRRPLSRHHLLLAAPAGDRGQSSVIGSRTGAHAGRLVALPDGAGTAFIPEHGVHQRRDGSASPPCCAPRPPARHRGRPGCQAAAASRSRSPTPVDSGEHTGRRGWLAALGSRTSPGTFVSAPRPAPAAGQLQRRSTTTSSGDIFVSSDHTALRSAR